MTHGTSPSRTALYFVGDTDVTPAPKSAGSAESKHVTVISLALLQGSHEKA